MAPEIVLQQGHGKPVDFWALGTLIYEMIVGLPPFYSKNVQEMYSKILHEDLVFPEDVSDEACDLIARLLERDPLKRLGSAKGWIEVKNHPFYKDIDFEMFLKKQIPPPYKPKVDGPLDTSYFDEEFTKQNPKDSPTKGHKLNEDDQSQFEGFTFSGDKEFAVKETPLIISLQSPK